VGEPDIPQNFSTGEERSIRKTLKPSSLPYSSIGPMAIALVYHPRMMVNAIVEFAPDSP
jgi:hypothetical protein